MNNVKKEVSPTTLILCSETKYIKLGQSVAEEHLPRGIVETAEEKKKQWFVGSIDQGTTSTRFIIFDGHGDPVTSHQTEFENKYPHSGYIDPFVR